MELKVILISNYLPDGQDSMIRFSELISSELILKGVRVEIIHPVERIGKLRAFFPRLEKWLFYIDKYIIFPFELIAHRWNQKMVDQLVYHITDHSNAIYSFFLKNRPLVVTCHDVLAIRSAIGEIPKNPTGKSGELLQKFILKGLKKSKRIVCVSENTERDLRRLLGDCSQKISTILNPLNFDYFPLSRENAILKTHTLGNTAVDAIHQGFILHVGGNQWYKNRIGACKIYASMARGKSDKGVPIPHLLLAGKKPSNELCLFVSENPDLPIKFVLSPTTEELQALYSLATALLFPSLEEGFGWPILEAMACGCPVITTSQPPMTEVGSNAAIYINPEKISESARILNQVTEWSEVQRREQVQKGFENLFRFLKSDFINRYISAYSGELDSRA